MPATKGEKIGVGVIAFLMILSVLGGSILYFLQQETIENEIVENRELEEQFEVEQQRNQARFTVCNEIANAIVNEDLEEPEAFVVDSEVTELEITDLVEGDGEEVESGDCVAINYHGTLAVDGGLFDSSYTRAVPFSTYIGIGNVIPGWDEGIIGLKEGGKRRLVIPYDMAYGEEGRTRDFAGELLKDIADPEKEIDPTVSVDSDGDGRVDYIPEKAALVFEVELLDVLKADEAEKLIDAQIEDLEQASDADPAEATIETEANEEGDS